MFPTALPEQKRIVAEVEKLENQIATARAVLTATPERKRTILEKWVMKEKNDSIILSWKMGYTFLAFDFVCVA